MECSWNLFYKITLISNTQTNIWFNSVIRSDYIMYSILKICQKLIWQKGLHTVVVVTRLWTIVPWPRQSINLLKRWVKKGYIRDKYSFTSILYTCSEPIRFKIWTYKSLNEMILPSQATSACGNFVTFFCQLTKKIEDICIAS